MEGGGEREGVGGEGGRRGRGRGRGRGEGGREGGVSEGGNFKDTSTIDSDIKIIFNLLAEGSNFPLSISDPMERKFMVCVVGCQPMTHTNHKRSLAPKPHSVFSSATYFVQEQYNTHKFLNLGPVLLRDFHCKMNSVQVGLF